MREPNYHEKFYKPKFRKEATKSTDAEAEVSNAVCTDEERNTENRRELHHFKLKFKKAIQKETEWNHRTRKLLQERICVLEKKSEEDDLEKFKLLSNESKLVHD